MPILKAVGFGVLLIVLKLMLPDVLKEGERTTVLMLQAGSASAIKATELIEAAPAHSRPPSLPQAPRPTSF